MNEDSTDMVQRTAAAAGVSDVDYWNLKQGDVDPGLGRRIEVLVAKDTDFIVYLDEQHDVQWHTASDTWPESAVLDEVAELEAASEFLRREGMEATLRSIRVQIAEAVRCAIVEGHEPAAPLPRTLAVARARIDAENKALSRVWFAGPAALFGLLSALAALVVVLLPLGGGALRETLSVAACGGVGAMVSVFLANAAIPLDARAGRRAHEFEAFARIATGVVAATLLCLLVQGGLLLTLAEQSPNRLALMMGVGIVAGASERMLPGLITRVESAIDAPLTKPA